MGYFGAARQHLRKNSWHFRKNGKVMVQKTSRDASVATWRHFISLSIPRNWQLLQTEPLHALIPEDIPRRLGNLLLSLVFLNKNNTGKTLKRSGCRHRRVVCWWARTTLPDFCRNRQFPALFPPRTHLLTLKLSYLSSEQDFFYRKIWSNMGQFGTPLTFVWQITFSWNKDSAIRPSITSFHRCKQSLLQIN